MAKLVEKEETEVLDLQTVDNIHKSGVQVEG